MADKRVEKFEDDPYTDLRFLGVVGLADPPAEGVRDATAESEGKDHRPVCVARHCRLECYNRWLRVIVVMEIYKWLRPDTVSAHPKENSKEAK